MTQRSEITYCSLKGLIIRPFLEIALYFLRFRCPEFWSLRNFALRHGQWAKSCYSLYLSKFGASIPLGVNFAGPPIFPHGVNGVIICSIANIGKNVIILHQVTIGEDCFASRESNRANSIGDSVFIGAGAKIIGGVKIGSNCRIGANCCVYKDMPPNSVAVSSPTRIIQKAALVNEYRGGNGALFKDGYMEVKK